MFIDLARRGLLIAYFRNKVKINIKQFPYELPTNIRIRTIYKVL